MTKKVKNNQKTYDIVTDYYGKTLSDKNDLKTTACCDFDTIPDYLKPILSNIHEEVLSHYYGCGLIVPECIKGLKILDLGSGAGRDVYALSALVGQNGHVTGVDMTQEQLDIANKHIDFHTKDFGYTIPNVTFIKGTLESLDQLGFKPESFDLVVSNCVINLSPQKEKILKDVYSLLKPGGEFYFSDIYSDRRVSAKIANDPVLYGECLGGALYEQDFIRIARAAQFPDPRLINRRELVMTDEKIKSVTLNTRFFSQTYRLWKIEGLEDDCEDYGHIATYKGNSPVSQAEFILDDEHIFHNNLPERICGNTAKMIAKTRFNSFFEISGTFDEHFGTFHGCGTSVYQALNPTKAEREQRGTCC